MNKPYNFDTPVVRRGTSSVKWSPNAIRGICGNPEALPFWVADMDVVSPQPVQQALLEVATLGAYGYPDFKGQEELFCEWVLKRHGWEVAPQQVTICQGMLLSIALLTEMLTSPTDTIIVPMPAYQPFVRMVKNHDRTLAKWHLQYDAERNVFTPDLQELERLCQDEHTTLLVFCSPQNPTGIVWDRQTLQQIAEIAARNNVFVISDEIHSDLTFDGCKHIPFASIAQESGCQAVTCMAPSKTFNIAGEHYSVVVFNDQRLQEAFEKRQEQLFLTEPSLFSGTAAIAGYSHGKPWLDQLRAYLSENVSFMDQYCRQHIPTVHVVMPQASFICLLECSALMPFIEEDARRNPDLYDPKKSPSGGLLSRFFGLRAGIAVNDGTWFGGEAYRNFVRFNFGTSKECVAKAMQQLHDAVQLLIS